MPATDSSLLDALPNDLSSTVFPYVSVQIGPMLLNLVIGFVLATLIGFHFRKYASAFCNRQDFSRLFPMLMLSVILIISVVKASLALALGLVGALSIVRFRTPIKEPEELLYLFLNIGVAVALGAGQTVAALVACTVTLLLITLSKQGYNKNHHETGLFLQLNYCPASPPDTGDGDLAGKVSVHELKTILEKYVNRIELRRFDVDSTQFDATFFLSVGGAKQIDDLMSSIQARYQGINISLLEQHNIAGV